MRRPQLLLTACIAAIVALGVVAVWLVGDGGEAPDDAARRDGLRVGVDGHEILATPASRASDEMGGSESTERVTASIELVVGGSPSAAPGADPGALPGTQRPALFGTVRDLRGGAIAIARVELAIGDDPRFRGAAISDEQGAYRIAAWPTEDEWGRLQQLQPHVTATAAGFAPLFVDPYATFFTRRPGDRQLDLWLTRGAVLVGAVVAAADGRPVAGAKLTLTAIFADGEPPLATATSADDGSFRLASVPTPTVDVASVRDERSGKAFGSALDVEAPGFASLSKRIELLQEGEERELTVALVRTGSLRGRVVDPGGRPHEGVRVGVSGTAGTGTPFRTEGAQLDTPFALTDAHGRYLLRDVPVGDDPAGWRVRAWREATPGWTPNQEDAVLWAHVVPGEVVTLPDLTVQRLPFARLLVVQEDGVPIAGAGISLAPRMRPSWRTDEHGIARVTVIDGSTIAVGARVVVGARGFAPAWSPPLEQRDFEPQLVTVMLERGVTMRGQVVDPAGAPARRAGVMVVDGSVDADALRRSLLETLSVGPEAWWADTAVGRDGTFRLDDLPKRRCHVVAYRGALQGRGASQVVLLADQATDAQSLRLVLPGEPTPPVVELGTIDVVLRLDAGSTPILSAAGVTLAREAAAAAGRLVAPNRVRFESIPFDRWELSVRIPGFRGERRPVVVVDADHRHVELEVALDRGVLVTGRVAGIDFASLRDRVIRFVGVSGDELSGELDGEGRFAISGFRSAAVYRIEIEAWDPPQSRRCWIAARPSPFVAPPEAVLPLEIEAIAAGWLVVAVDSDFVLPPATLLRLEPLGGGAPTVTPFDARRDNGDTAFFLPAGRVRVTFESEGRPLASQETEVHADATGWVGFWFE